MFTQSVTVVIDDKKGSELNPSRMSATVRSQFKDSHTEGKKKYFKAASSPFTET